ncbi:hypothetical protein LINGRAHAP2_LOCUS31285 [Linum grandiflorum]
MTSGSSCALRRRRLIALFIWTEDVSMAWKCSWTFGSKRRGDPRSWKIKRLLGSEQEAFRFI